MGFLKKWFFKKRGVQRTQPEQAECLEREEESTLLRRDDLDLGEQGQRRRYVESCLEQMQDAEKALEALMREYNLVTSYLTDMEEIEALPEGEKKELVGLADKITAYEKEKQFHEEGAKQMPESTFSKMERMEEEVSEGISKLTQAEDYQEKIRQDMRRLAGEKHAYQYRKHDLKNTMVNLRGMMVITSFAFVTCMVLLLLLQLLLEMDIRLGYILTAGATAFTVFLIYLKYTEAAKEKKQVERGINKLILLQNRVKIRYVNNTNLLEYLYVKYQVQSAGELSELWEAYQIERQEREKRRELHEELELLRRELLRLLGRFQIKYPEIWLRQSQALSNRKEMVEIRHGLILRRQKLRKQMEYNEKLAAHAQSEVKSLAEEFPAYAAEIMELVSQYEGQTRREGA